MPWFKYANLSLPALKRNVVFVLDPEYKFIQLRANKFGNRINIENLTFLSYLFIKREIQLLQIFNLTVIFQVFEFADLYLR